MKTIKNEIKNEIIIEKSKFICSLKSVDTFEQAIEFINSLKKEHYNASHNCSALIIGLNSNTMRSSDDGEPSGTAGNPMLNVLKMNNLSNIVVVVTRYFGGIKLGTGGLIRAYTQSVTSALKTAEIITVKEMTKVEITVNYSIANLIKNKIDYLLLNIEYTKDVKFLYLVDKNCLDSFLETFTKLTNANFEYNILETVIHSF